MTQPVLDAAINNGAAARQAADTTLQNNINLLGSSSVSQAALDAEIAARSLGDSTLQSAIDVETAARVAADTALEIPTDQRTLLAQLVNVMAITTLTLNGLPGPHVILHHTNVHVQSGLGQTYAAPTNGTGNLTTSSSARSISTSVRVASLPASTALSPMLVRVSPVEGTTRLPVCIRASAAARSTPQAASSPA